MLSKANKDDSTYHISYKTEIYILMRTIFAIHVINMHSFVAVHQHHIIICYQASNSPNVTGLYVKLKSLKC